jgi:hypothetical protein
MWKQRGKGLEKEQIVNLQGTFVRINTTHRDEKTS